MWNEITVGTCSQCSGRVSLPRCYMSVVPPIPTCDDCGAQAVPNHGPVVKTQ